jgi:hypothetical protein
VIPLLTSWTAIVLLACGVGAICWRGLARAVGPLDPDTPDVFRLFWTGVAATIAVAQAWSLFLPLDAVALALWGVAGAAGLPSLARRRGGREGTPPSSRLRLLLFAVAALLVVYVGAAGLATTHWSRAYDTDLYHFNSIRWMNEHAAVPGLGNLHARLAHTSGLLVFSALLDNVFWDRASAWIVPGLLTTVASLQWLWTLLVAPRRGRGNRDWFFCCLTLPYLAALQCRLVPSLYYDDAALVVQLLLVGELLRWFPHSQQPNATAPGDQPGWPGRFVMTALLAALGFSFKSIGAMSLLLTGVYMLAGFLWIGHLVRWVSWRSFRRLLRFALAVVVIPALLLAGHVARNAMLSGWLAYPAPIGRLDVDWAMPRHPVAEGGAERMQSVQGQYEVIRAWAKLPGESCERAINGGLGVWLPQWIEREWRGVERWVLPAGLVFMLAHLAMLARRRGGGPSARHDVFLMLLAVANLVFWFASAPDLRFGAAFIWMGFGIGGALLLTDRWLKPREAAAVAVVLAAAAFAAIPVRPATWRVVAWRHLGRARALPTHEVVVANGQTPPLVVRVPRRGDCCGDSPIPATPYPLETLKMRKPGDVSAGFRRKRF